MSTSRRLAAILAADVAGYSRLMAADEVGTLEALKACRREVVDPAIAAHHGRIVKTTGDGMLVEFASAVDAVTCAWRCRRRWQAAAASSRSASASTSVTSSSRATTSLATASMSRRGWRTNASRAGCAFRRTLSEQIRNKTTFAFDDLGERTLKNIDRPVRVYAVRSQDAAAASVTCPIRQALPLPDKPSIAVLPFQNMSGDPEQEYFADGMVEDIITALSRIPSLFVIARNSSFAYKGKAIDIRQVGRELGVRYVLEGSVRKAGQRLRITGQLVEAETGSHLWADRFDSVLEDVFDLQDRVTMAVAGAIEPSMTQAEIRRANRKPTENLQAYDWLLRALGEQQLFSRDGFDRAMHMARRAIELDPRYAQAYAYLANWILLRKILWLDGG